MFKRVHEYMNQEARKLGPKKLITGKTRLAIVRLTTGGASGMGERQK